MAKKTAKVDAGERVQEIYRAIHERIKDLPNADAIAVLEEVSGHCEGMVEGMKEEMTDEGM